MSESKFTIHIAQTIAERDLCTLLTDAVEGGMMQWARIIDVTRDVEDHTITGVRLIEVGDGDENVRHLVKPETMARGIERILNRAEGCHVCDEIMHMAQAMLDPDNCDVDAWGADAILQAGLLGEVRYG